MCTCGRVVPVEAAQGAFIRRLGMVCSACGNELSADDVVEVLRLFLRERLADGADCPGCGKWAKRYNRKLNSGMARWLLELVRRSPDNSWVDSAEVTAAIGDLGKDATTLLPAWGLIEGCSVCQRASVFWRPTQLGRDFVAGAVTVPLTIYAYNRECLGHDTTKGYVSIREALGDSFDYDELMKTPG